MCHSHAWGGRKIKAKWVALRMLTVASRSACWATWAFGTALSSVPPRALMMCFLEEGSLCLWGSFQAADTRSASSDVCSRVVATISLWPHGRRDPERQSDSSDGKMYFLETQPGSCWLWKVLTTYDALSLCLNLQPMETHKLLLNQVGAGGGSFWGQVMEGWEGGVLRGLGAERWRCSQPGE